MKQRRLDVEMVERGLAESREQAQRFILAGEVWVDGQRWDKASKPCAAGLAIEVRGGERYVSRGGVKLEGALTGFSLDVTGLRCLDVGASTGGFTDCLLQHGAREVVAVDAGRLELIGIACTKASMHAIPINSRRPASAGRSTSSWPIARSSRCAKSCLRPSICLTPAVGSAR